MFNSQVLEVAIGLSFVFLLLSVICSMLNEWLGKILFNLRPSVLLEGIQSILPEDLVVKFYNHPLIKGFFNETDKPEASSLADLKSKNLFRYLPSYIPARSFAMVLQDIIAQENSAVLPAKCEELRDLVARLDETKFPQMAKIKHALLPLIDEARGNLVDAQANIEQWFNDTMERVTGWYKRKSQTILVVIAIIITVSLNVDTFTIANTLYRQGAVRAAVVAAADNYLQKPAIQTRDVSLDYIKEVNDQLLKLNLPMGWWEPEADKSPGMIPKDWRGWTFKCFGWVFTALAISLGAPFWFDLLNKMVNLRSSGKPPGKDEKAKSV